MQLIDRTFRAADPMPPGRDVKNEQQNSKPTMATEPHFEQLIGVLRRRSRLILTMAAFGTILAGVTGLLITPKYTAKAQIVVEPRGATLLSPEAVQEVIDTHVTMLTSANHLQHVADSLLNEPEFRGAASETRTEIGASASGPDGDARSRSAATAQAPAKAITTEAGPLSFKELRRRLDVWSQALTSKRGDGTELMFDELERRLKVLQERRSRVITISFQWTSPEKAAAIANRIVELYVQSQTEEQRAYSTRELARLEERIAAITSDVEWTSAALNKAIQRRFDSRQSVSSEEQEAEVDPSELKRWAAASAQLKATLLQRQKEIREQQELIKPGANILSLASPPARPSSPNPILFMIPALIAFSICGSLLAVVLDRLDRGLRCEREINDALGISCIGLVPQIPPGRLTHLGKYLAEEPFSPYAEAIRSAVATLRLAEPGHDAAKVVLISSSAPKEGKTTVASSIAVYVASLGRRVLLLDFDCRRDPVHRDLGGKVESGIPDLTRQHGSPTETIQHVGDLGLHYLPMPRCGSDPLAMFAHERVLPLLRKLRENYDSVIVDGPPVLGASEVRLLASMVDKVVFVVKWGSTRRELAREALDLLRDSTCFDQDYTDFPVAIVTQVELKRHNRYSYGDVGEFLLKYRQYIILAWQRRRWLWRRRH
jgi:polysaccharide biosynthesis transport protein